MIRYRTLVGVIGLGLILLGGLGIAGYWPNAAGVYTSFAVAVAGLGAWLAGKSATEHLAGGGGIKGAFAALLTSQKPEPVAESPQAPPPAPSEKPPEGAL